MTQNPQGLLSIALVLKLEVQHVVHFLAYIHGK